QRSRPNDVPLNILSPSSGRVSNYSSEGEHTLLRLSDAAFGGADSEGSNPESYESALSPCTPQSTLSNLRKVASTALTAAGPPRLRLGIRRKLGRFLGELFRLVEVGAAARHERRADVLRDRLLRDDALGDVPAGGQLEHHVEQGILDDRPQAAGPGLPLE